ncbi:MAG: sodium:solute symporter [Brevinema sp.]
MGWSIVDGIVLVLYLGFLVWLGYFFSKRRSNSDDYFVGGQRIPAWVAAFSLYATGLSSISYVATTSNVYQSGWIFAVGVLGIIPLIPLVAEYFVPFVRRLKCVTAYEYLEVRFDRPMRLFASAVFILFHVMRIAIVIFIPTLAFREVWPNVNPLLIVAVMGFLCVIYTTVGGFEAVVWSDTIQTILLIGAAVLVMAYGFLSIPAGVNGFETLVADGKVFPPENFSFDPRITTVWWLFIGGFFGSIYQYIGSQDMVQRYSSTKDLKEAKKTLYMQFPLLFTSVIMFTGMGSAIYLFYKFNGAAPELVNNNALLPYFVINELPIGLSGLVIAGIFAAAQSTVSSSLNSTATCALVDFIAPLKKSEITDNDKIVYAQWISWLAGIIGTIIAMVFITQGQSDMYVFFNSILGLLGSPIAGVFLLGIFSNKVSSQSAWIGFGISIFVALYLGNPGGLFNLIPGYVKPDIFGFLFAPIVIASCMIPGYLASLVLPAPSKEHLDGLTYSSLSDQSDIY